MIAILGFLARLSVILGFVGIVFSSISDILFRTDYLGQLDSFIDLSSLNFKILVGLLSIIYLVVFLLSYINKLTKYSQNRKVKNKNGEIEVSIKTINETSKDFLNGQEIIKNSKVKSYPKGKSVVIEATVDTYNVDNLNEKLAEIQNKLSEYVFHSTGITVKKSKVKLKKVLGETIVEKKIIDSPTNQKENIKKNNNNIISKLENQTNTENINPNFAGKNFLFTGTLKHFTREQIKEEIEKLGGKNLSSVSKNLDYLIVGEKAGSKLKKAQEIPTIKILTEEEFIELKDKFD